MAKGIRWKGNAGPHSYTQRISELGSEFEEDIEKSMSNYMKFGQQRTKVRVQQARQSRSGELVRNIGLAVTKRGHVITGKFGWLKGEPKYAMFQERGTYDSHVDADGRPAVVNPGKPGIEPMLALLDSFVEVRDHMQTRGFL